MTRASRILPGRRGGAVRGLIAAALALAAAPPGPAAAQGCDVRSLGEVVSTTTMRNESNENFACIRLRLETLETERDELERRLEQVERQGAGEPGVYRKEDGRVIRDERHFAPATFELTGDRGGRPRSLELDRDRVLERCGDAEGCLLTLGLEGVVVDGAPVRAMFAAGPCHFHLDGEENDWVLSGRCPPAGLPAGAAEDDGPDAGTPVPAGPVWGRDGDARPLGDTERAAQVILGFGGACYLAEAEPETRDGAAGGARLARDTRPDLFLVTAGAGWDPGGTFPAALLPLDLGDPDFRCSLTLRD